MKRQGIWFYGLAGSRKTYASQLLASNLKLPFIIDGDTVRTIISTELGYTSHDRKIQIGRILGISLMSIQNGYFPIASSVTMCPNILDVCADNLIEVLEIDDTPSYGLETVVRLGITGVVECN